MAHLKNQRKVLRKQLPLNCRHLSMVFCLASSCFGTWDGTEMSDEMITRYAREQFSTFYVEALGESGSTYIFEGRLQTKFAQEQCELEVESDEANAELAKNLLLSLPPLQYEREGFLDDTEYKAGYQSGREPVTIFVAFVDDRAEIQWHMRGGPKIYSSPNVKAIRQAFSDVFEACGRDIEHIQSAE